MSNAKAIRDDMRAMTYNGKPRFQMLDAGDAACLPVVAARFNPELDLPYDAIDFQNALSCHHWYVSGYKMSFKDPMDESVQPLFSDVDQDATMMRVVVKANLIRHLVDDLLASMRDVLSIMDGVGP